MQAKLWCQFKKYPDVVKKSLKYNEKTANNFSITMFFEKTPPMTPPTAAAPPPAAAAAPHEEVK